MLASSLGYQEMSAATFTIHMQIWQCPEKWKLPLRLALLEWRNLELTSTYVSLLRTELHSHSWNSDWQGEWDYSRPVNSLWSQGWESGEGGQLPLKDIASWGGASCLKKKFKKIKNQDVLISKKEGKVVSGRRRFSPSPSWVLLAGLKIKLRQNINSGKQQI